MSEGPDKGWIPYDPVDVRVEHDRVFLPGIGWVRAPGCRPLPKNARLTKCEVINSGSNWEVVLEVDDGG